jgi:hypothetical protein
MHTLPRPAPHPRPTAVRRPTGGSLAVRALTDELLAIGRDRWPHADVRGHHGRIRWTDGPNYTDMHTAATEAGITPDDLELAGIALQRTISARMLAYATVAATPPDRHLSRAQALVDDLLRFPTPADGPPFLLDPPLDLDRLWHRSASLVHLDGDRPPILADHRDAILGDLHRLKMLTAMAGPDALDRGIRLIPATSIRPDSGGTRIEVTSNLAADHQCAIRIARWPDRLFTACTSSNDDEPTPALHWIDGPSTVEVHAELEHPPLPSPFEGCSSYTLHRSLSATGIAASVLLHQQLVGEPYQDTAIGYHWMQQWKLAPVRDLARREAPGRARLERIQHQLLERPLPPAGELAMAGQGGTTVAVDGAKLWTRAEVLSSLLQPRPEPDIGHTPGHHVSRRLSLILADLLANVGPTRLDLLVATPHP